MSRTGLREVWKGPPAPKSLHFEGGLSRVGIFQCLQLGLQFRDLKNSKGESLSAGGGRGEDTATEVGGTQRQGWGGHGNRRANMGDGNRRIGGWGEGVWTWGTTDWGVVDLGLGWGEMWGWGAQGWSDTGTG